MSVTPLSILTADQFDKSQLDELIEDSTQIAAIMQKQKTLPLLNDRILATLFFEPSTRTRLSFESAMIRLGGHVITAVGMQFSSLAKGETLYDTLKVMESYADVCAIRHPQEGASAKAAASISIPVINAGDGAGEHPTQGLLDLFTIARYKKLGEENVRVAFVGDIKYGRTIHSLLQLLSHYPVELVFISPPELGLPQKYVEFLTRSKIRFESTSKLEAIENCDVGYITRIQGERFVDHQQFEKLRDYYVINKALVQKCKKDLIIMHPLPRLSEISTDLDDMPQAIYFEQAKNGLYLRMALLLKVLNVKLPSK
ncbi:MAG: aspartate carbamoyltransferase [Leptospirales bacterium]